MQNYCNIIDSIPNLYLNPYDCYNLYFLMKSEN